MRVVPDIHSGGGGAGAARLPRSLVGGPSPSLDCNFAQTALRPTTHSLTHTRFSSFTGNIIRVNSAVASSFFGLIYVQSIGTKHGAASCTCM